MATPPTFHGSRSALARDAILFIALLATALALGAALAHALELPNKIDLPRDEYFIVQQAYRGWDRLGYLLAVQLLAMILTALLSRHEPRVVALVIVAIAGLLAAQAVFWIYTYPANVATADWTRMPDDWERLRRTWEYSHAVGAGFQLLAMCALLLAALVRRPLPSRAA
ncbi:MAG TPA: hypothetical protein VNS22_22820 [Geminicoccus sp.]|uniref:hypothetical protein n=1 Tax=Geminicoccus sp. TaxID=2024832 RepID=UPI002C27532F|nr:hypothetical protein [Geminicoccus sp.]HWL71191.1 hypothetical protein [Geminicoccus sp.]